MSNIISVKLDAIGASGDGTALLPEGKAYMPGGLPGDRVQFKVLENTKGIRYLPHEILAKGPLHQKSVCGHYGVCGGCSLQHLNTDAYDLWLDEKLLRPLERAGISPETLESPVKSPPHSRRRVALKSRSFGSKVQLGYSQSKSHQIVAIRECPVMDNRLAALIQPLNRELGKLSTGKKYSPTVHLTLTHAGIDLVIAGVGALSLEGRESLAHFADSHDIAALHVQMSDFMDPIAIRRQPVMRWHGISVDLPPAAFIQATSNGEKTLQAQVLKGVQQGDKIMDLFAGIGTFSIPLAAAKTQVAAYEANQIAVEALAKTRRNDGFGLSVHERDLFRRPLLPFELKGIDRVIIDPPRAGATNQALHLAESNVPHIVFVSCNPATFARDAKTLNQGGYQLKSLQAVDQFLWSDHLELVAHFEKK